MRGRDAFPLYYLNFYYTIFSSDFENLTVTNICNKLDEFSDQWMKVASFLRVDDVVVNSVLVSRLDDQSSLRKIVQWWFMNTANPEWKTVLEVFDSTYVTYLSHTNFKQLFISNLK